MVPGRLPRFLGLWIALAVALSGALVDVGSSGAASKPASVDPAARLAGSRDSSGLVPVVILRSRDGAAVQAVKAKGGATVRTLKLGRGLVAKVPASSLDALAREPGVTRIAYDAPVRSTAQPDRDDRALATVYPLAVEAADLWSAGNRGQGIGVAILDSGVDQHVDYGAVEEGGRRSGRNRLVARVAAAVTSAGPPADDYGHGTWVAGIVGGSGVTKSGARSGRNGKYVGVAPDANLIGVKVSNRDGVSRVSDVVAGIEWVVDNKDRYNIKVLNLSMSQTVPESYRTSLLNAAVELAWLKGIVVVVSAGNLGPDSALFPPANDPYAIVVGATDDAGTPPTGDDRLAWFSSYGRTQDGFAKPDLVAPGRRIVSTLNSQRSTLARQFPDRITGGDYIRLSGTSASAPMVSGVAALVLQARPGLQPGQVKWLLRRTAQALPGAGTGAGYPKAAQAVRYAGSLGDSNRGLVPNHAVARAGCRVSPTVCGSSDWTDTSWDKVSWKDTSWDDTSWDDTSWDRNPWDDTSWDDTSWDDTSWDRALRD